MITFSILYGTFPNRKEKKFTKICIYKFCWGQNEQRTDIKCMREASPADCSGTVTFLGHSKEHKGTNYRDIGMQQTHNKAGTLYQKSKTHTAIASLIVIATFHKSSYRSLIKLKEKEKTRKHKDLFPDCLELATYPS